MLESKYLAKRDHSGTLKSHEFLNPRRVRKQKAADISESSNANTKLEREESPKGSCHMLLNGYSVLQMLCKLSYVTYIGLQSNSALFYENPENHPDL